jgi:hypothetical protein
VSVARQLDGPAEVRELDLVVGCEQEVLGLEVAVQDLPVLQVPEGADDLAEVARDLRLFERALGERGLRTA